MTAAPAPSAGSASALNSPFASFKGPETEDRTYDSVKSVFEDETTAVVDALLCPDEATRPEGASSPRRIRLARIVPTRHERFAW